MKQLPSEMVHLVAGILRDASDFPTLLECCLVCHTWNNICRPYAVHTISVRTQNFYARLEFLNFTAPHLSEHIVELTLQWADCIRHAPVWTPDCLLRLKGLRILRLKNSHATPPPMVPAPFALGIISLITAVPLKVLHLECWSFLKDSSDLLRILSCCSSSLEDLFIQTTAYDHSTIPGDETIVDDGRTVSSPVRLKSLRILRLFEWIGRSPLPPTDLLECPNLERLELAPTLAGPWDIPSWIPDGLQELVLRVEPGTWMPDLGTSIRPSRLTIDITNHGYPNATYLEVMAWVEISINCLPFPGALRHLTVRINTYLPAFEPLHFLELDDYMTMSAALLQIHEHLNLEGIVVNIIYTMAQGDARDLELPKLDVAFSQLLDTGLFHVTFEWSDGHEQSLMHHVFRSLDISMPLL